MKEIQTALDTLLFCKIFYYIYNYQHNINSKKIDGSFFSKRGLFEVHFNAFNSSYHDGYLGDNQKK